MGTFENPNKIEEIQEKNLLWPNFSTLTPIAPVGCGEPLNTSVNTSGHGSEV